jgi:hypothetical protein
MSRVLTDNRLWKPVENFPVRESAESTPGRLSEVVLPAEPGCTRDDLSACSACAGDYEDPDRTAWTPDDEDVDEQQLPSAEERAADYDEPDDEFPAREA